MKFVTQRFSQWPAQVSRSDWADLFGDFDRFFDGSFTPVTRAGQNFPAVDIDETDNHYLLSFDLPGMKKDEINIEVHGQQLVVSGERQKLTESKDEGGYRGERSYGRFQRSFRLPEGLPAHKIEAHYENGVLQLLLPKAEPEKSKKIEIQSGKDGFFKKFLGSKKDEEPTLKDVKIS